MSKQNQISITDDWRLYDDGKEYNKNLSPNYYATTNRNERFYAGDQWKGIKINGYSAWTLNIFKRTIDFFIATIMSRRVKMQFSVDNVSDTTAKANEQMLLAAAKMLSEHSTVRWERLKMDTLLREALLDGALSGDMAAYTYWDDMAETGQHYGLDPATQKKQPIKGDFVTELVDGCNVMFGNPNDRRVNFNGRPLQPYIIIAGRDMVSNLRKEAKAHKKENELTDKDIETLIVSDVDYEEQAGDRSQHELTGRGDGSGKATYIIKLWPENGTIYFSKSVKSAYIRKNVDTRLKQYPVAWTNWTKRKNSYHGQAVGTGLVNNQIEINRNYAKIFKWIGDMAFPKIAYNSDALPNGLTNKIGELIPVDGAHIQDISKVIYPIQPAQMANGVMSFLSQSVKDTMEMMGVSDAALGNVKNPENTSALIAVRESTAVPLGNIEANLYQFVEDIGYTWFDFMMHRYDVPRVLETVNEDGIKGVVEFNPAELVDAKFRIKVDVGPSSYWSEIASVQTLDNLYKQGKLTPKQYFERMPDGYIPMREKLLEDIQKQEAAQKDVQKAMFDIQNGIGGGAVAGSPM